MLLMQACQHTMPDKCMSTRVVHQHSSQPTMSLANGPSSSQTTTMNLLMLTRTINMHRRTLPLNATITMPPHCAMPFPKDRLALSLEMVRVGSTEFICLDAPSQYRDVLSEYRR